ncbi:GrpB family protein [Aliarcobacter lanthieri]|uniref:GrpB family protein n=1 Tax=Aliarcobacter lanthieri TaxID=1355374 RepID=UPI003AFAE302
MKKEILLKEANKIMIFEEGDPNENPWVLGQPKIENIEVTDYNPDWAIQFNLIKNNLDIALADKALSIEHIGSTAVPGLSAKPVIDIDVIISDPEDEDSYVSSLVEIGYTLTVRERSWYQHRMFRHELPRINLHIFGPNCPEYIRHILFRDWLCQNNEDRKLYCEAKMKAQDSVNTAQAYNIKKQAIVLEIYSKIFKFYNLTSVN